MQALTVAPGIPGPARFDGVPAPDASIGPSAITALSTPAARSPTAAFKHTITADRPVLPNVPSPVAADEARDLGASGGPGQAP